MRAALETLCRAYWFPLYAVARHRGQGEHDAEDVVQAFFLSLLRRETFQQADESQGKLRNLLLKAFQNFSASEWRKTQALKRGEGVVHVELLQTADAELKFIRQGNASDLPIETLYNREWARSVLERGLDALRAKFESRGDGERFALLSRPLMLADEDVNMEALASEAGMSCGAFRTALHRVRLQYREMIERELATLLDTDDPVVIKEELRELFRAFS